MLTIILTLVTTAAAVILEGGPAGNVALDSIDARPLPFTREILDEQGMHSDASPTCIVVPKRARYRIVAAVAFELDESGERELYVTTTTPGEAPRQIGQVVSVVPDQTFQLQLAIFAQDTIEAGDCVELYAGAPGHGALNGQLFALVVGFALWEN